MNFYVDESGNTGETLSKEFKFNFEQQPNYVLSGILLDEEQQTALRLFLESQVEKFKVQGNELKAGNLYNSNPKFVTEFVDYLLQNNIPFFIELMDKCYYLNFQLIEYFIVPYYSMPLNDENIFFKRFLASNLSKVLNQDIYQNFINTVKENTNESLENFYETLINHFQAAGRDELKLSVEQTKIDYFEAKEIDAVQALKKFSPIPDENPKQRLLHFLPNFNAFTNLVARAQRYIDENLNHKEFQIVHDEQKQFDIIFKSGLKQMKNVKTDEIVQDSNIEEKARFNIEESIDITFKDSKTDILIQASDLISGVVMRFWIDFLNDNEEKIKTYLPIIKQLHYPYDKTNVGINYVVPDFDHEKIIKRIR